MAVDTTPEHARGRPRPWLARDAVQSKSTPGLVLSRLDIRLAVGLGWPDLADEAGHGDDRGHVGCHVHDRGRQYRVHRREYQGHLLTEPEEQRRGERAERGPPAE